MIAIPSTRAPPLIVWKKFFTARYASGNRLTTNTYFSVCDLKPSFETVNGSQVKKLKVNRPKAMCFNYAMLKAEFGLNLETEVISETEELAEDAEPTDSAPIPPFPATPTKPSSLFDPPDKEEDMPF